MSLLKNTRLQTKLIVSFILSSLMTLGVGVFAVFELGKVNNADTILYERATVPMADLLKLSVGFQRIRVNMEGIVGASSDAEVSKRTAQIEALRKEIDESSKAVEKTLISAKAKQIIEEYKVHRAAFRGMTDKVLKLKQAGDSAGAEAYLDSEGNKLADQYQDSINRLVESKEEQGHLLAQSNDELADFSKKMIFAAIAIGFILSVGQGMLLTREVMRQLGEDPGYLAEVAGKIADGDLDVTFRQQKKPGGVYHVLQNMVGTMKDKIAEAEQKSAEASEQAHHAEIATQEAQAAKVQAERAKAEGMLQAAHQLESVVEVVSTTTEQLSALITQSSNGAEEQSRRVSVTSSAMDEMNATVGEVAENAAKATQEVGGVIRGIQEGTRKSIDGVDKSVATIESATHRASLSGEALTQIVSLVEQASDQVRSIAAASEQQSASSEEISRSVEQVATISAETAQAMGRANQAMSEMAQQAQVLRRLIQEMKAG